MFIAIIVFVVLADQLSKLAVLSKLANEGDKFVLIDNVFEFKHSNNDGAFLGAFSDNRWVFMVISTVAIVAMLVYLIKMRKTSTLLVISLSFLIGGGIGNMIDRVRLGYVVDFLYAKFINFPIFNVADSFITFGAGLLIIYLIRLELADRKAKKLAAAAITTQSNADDEDKRDD